VRRISFLLALASFVFPALLFAIPSQITSNEAQPKEGGSESRWRPAAQFTVNATDDVSDGSCDLVHCSLREAIEAANTSAGPDRIVFLPEALKGSPIRLQSALPPAREALWIDGRSAQGGLVELDGTRAGSEASGLVVEAGWSTVQGLWIHGFAKDGLVVAGDLAVVEGNIVGSARAGGAGNGGSGIKILSAQNQVGGQSKAAGNQVSGNLGPGIELWGAAAQENRVEGNQIGLAAGEPAGNRVGVLIHGGAENNQIGSREAANEIAYQQGSGVVVDSGRYNVVEGNTIRDNGGSGVYQDKEARGAWVSANSIYDNLGPGIDAAPEHAEVRSRMPRLWVPSREANFSPGGVEVEFEGKPDREYSVEIFATESCQPGKNGARELLDRVTAAADRLGIVHFAWPWPVKVSPDQPLTVAVLRKGEMTSRFSTCPSELAGLSYTLKIRVLPSNSGQVTGPAGVCTSSGLDCYSVFGEPTAVAIFADSYQGYCFGEWTGECDFSSYPACSFILDIPQVVTANFTQNKLTVVSNGSGFVRSAPVGISNCGEGGGVCEASFQCVTPVTLTATLGCSSGVNWSGCVPSPGDPLSCDIMMDSGPKTVTADFVSAQPSLTVELVKVGSSVSGSPGTVTSVPAGINCTTICSYAFDCGELVKLTATADPGWKFEDWSGPCSGFSDCFVTMDQARTIKAFFVRSEQYSLTVAKDGEGTVRSVSSPNPPIVYDTKIDCGVDCSEVYSPGTTVYLEAQPDTGWGAATWQGCLNVSPSGICQVDMDVSKAVVAIFPALRRNLTVTTAGSGVGTVSRSPAGTPCGTDCTSYAHGDLVILTANPDPSSSLEDWSAPCSGQSLTCEVTMDQDWQVTAYFAPNGNPQEYELTVDKIGEGTVVSDAGHPGINCGLDCTQSYSQGSAVTLTATPAAGWGEPTWQGCDGVSGRDCSVNMNAAKWVAVTFLADQRTLTVVKSGSGNGTFSSNIGGIFCAPGCSSQSASYTHGTLVTLTAVADSASVFEDWSAPCSGLATCVVTMDQARTVTAFFRFDRQLLTVTKTGEGTVFGPNINCGTACTELYDRNSVVGLSASPVTGWRLESWGGACSGSGACSVTMDAAKLVTASFVREVHTLSISVNNPGGSAPQGSVTVSPPGSSCTGSCSYNYEHDSMVTLEVSDLAGLTFTGWGGDGSCSGSVSPCTVTMNIARTVTASFTLDSYGLDVLIAGTGTGTVVGTGIACPGDCSETFSHGTLVNLTATPTGSSVFEDWSAPCSGLATCVVTMDQARTVTAFFRLARHELTITRTGEGTITGPGISCGTDCTEAYDAGTVVNLSQSAATGWQFSAWGGACSGSGACSVTMDAAKLVTATFVPQVHTLSVSVNNPGGSAPQGSVSISPPGSSCTGSCSYNYDYGTSVTLEVSIPAGLTFTAWGGDGSCSGTASTCTVTMNAARTVTASFTLKSYSLDVVLAGTGTGTVVGTGITCPGDCSETLAHGSQVTLTATPTGSSTFEDWSAPCSGLATCVVTMDQARTVTAFFRLDRHELTVTKSGEGTITGPGISCGTDCTEVYDAGSLVTLSQSPATGWQFSAWGGACSGSGACSVTMDAAKLVTATFVPQVYTLSVSVNNPGGSAPQGSVSISPPGSSCTGSCSYNYDHGTSVTLEVNVPAGLTFSGWGGSCSGTASTCTVTMNAALSVTASFTLNSYGLDVVLAGTGTGTVVGTGITCPGDCSETLAHGTQVTLTATPTGSSTFEDWSAPCSGLATCVVTMDQARTVTAFFRLARHELTVTKTGEGTITGPSISCGTDCTEVYDAGTVVNLSQSPATGWQFSAWGGACSGSGACSVTMDASKLVTATFVREVHTLSLSVINPGGAPQGSVSVSPPGSSCTGSCSYNYEHDSNVTLEVSIPAGLTFTGWGGDGSCSGTSSTCTVTMNTARTVTASFTLRSYDLEISLGGSGTGSVVAPGIICPADCTETYFHGTLVTLTATPAGSSTFEDWSPPCSGLATCVVTMDRAWTVTAFFNVRRLELTVDKMGEGDVTSSPAGIDCGLDCTHIYDYGTLVSLTPTPAPGWAFSSWSGACSGSGACVVTMDAVKSVTATFSPLPKNLSVTKSSSGTGTVTSSPAGIDCGGTCSADFAHGSLVTLTAVPDVSSAFEDWSAPCSGQSTCVLTMDQARTVTAFFQVRQIELTVGKNGEGTVTSTPAGIDCGTDCAQLYDYGTSVSLTPTPAFGWAFSSWSGACSGSGACTVTMDAAKTVTATFIPIERRLDVVVTNPAGAPVLGSVSVFPPGSTCSDDCTYNYDHGTQVTLSATVPVGLTFAGWGGSCSGSALTCVVTMDAAKLVTATFVKSRYTLSVATSGSGAGSVSSDVAGINCLPDCSEDYDHGQVVTLTANPAISSTFVGWSAPCLDGEPNPPTTCTVAMTQAWEVTATFDLKRHELTVSKLGAGSVGSAPAGIDCGLDCTQYFDYGTLVTLSATPDPGWDFAGWVGVCSGPGACLVNMNANKSVQARFTPQPRTLTLIKSGSGSGSVTSTPAGINCGATCMAEFPYAALVTLTAVADPSSTFEDWSAPCSGQAECVVSMDESHTVTAFFSLRSYELAVNKVGEGTVTSAPSGIDCGEDCTQSYVHGTVVTLTATPATGWVFSSWSPACGDPCAITMDAAKSVVATFTPIPRHLEVQITNPSGVPTPGSLTIFPPGTSCADNCSYDYDHGTNVTLTASVPPGLTFVGWGGDSCSGTALTCVVTMDAAKLVTATYVKNRYSLAVATSGSGVGSISSDVAGINCLPDCSEDYDHGQVVTLTASAAISSTFVGWSAPCLGGEPNPPTTCTVTMTQAWAVTATFDLKRHELTVTKVGAGSVGSAPAGIDCGLDCTQYYNYGTQVTLSATPDTGWVFAGWFGACSGPGECLVTMNDNQSAEARFTPQPRILTVTRSGSGTGTITSDPAGIDCGTTCTAELPYAALVTLTATPDVSSTFEDWSAPCSGQAECVVRMDEAHSVTAFFRVRALELRVNKAGGGGGLVTSDLAGILCGDDCEQVYNYGTTVTLTAAANSLSEFMGWDGPCVVGGGGSTCSVEMLAITEVTANFHLKQRLLTVVPNGNGSGSLSSLPGGIDCGGDCEESFDHGEVVTLTAIPGEGSYVTWAGCDYWDGSICRFTMSFDRVVRPTFTLAKVSLAVSKVGFGTGNITSLPSGINCGNDCLEDFDFGTSVTLTAIPGEWSIFTGWSGDCAGEAQEIEIVLTQARSCVATFEPESFENLVIELDGEGTGRVTSQPLGIDCGEVCEALFPRGTAVVLTAVPDEGSTFLGWGPGDCEVLSDTECEVVLGGGSLANVQAIFGIEGVLLELVIDQPALVGIVEIEPLGEICNQAHCVFEVNGGTQLTLTARSGSSAQAFEHWNGACQGPSARCTFVMSGNQQVQTVLSGTLFQDGFESGALDNWDVQQ